MINAQFNDYSYSTVGQLNSYGQQTVTPAASGVTVRMAINVLSQSTQDSILYSGAEYIGLTHDNSINDTYIIHYDNNVDLKVKAVVKNTRLNQVLLTRVSNG